MADESDRPSEALSNLGDGKSSDSEAGQETSSLKMLEDVDVDLVANYKFDDLIAAAEAAFTVTLSQTATTPCDTKLNLVEICNRLISILNSDDCGHHITFFPYAEKWLDWSVKYLCDHQELTLARDSSDDREKTILDAICCILNYMSNVLNDLKFILSISTSKEYDMENNEFQGGSHVDWNDDYSYFNSADEDEESIVDDSDNESLSNKLCTFTLTKKEFINQHWYHCHTCNMIDVVGVCSVCAKVCHKNHDISYAKYGAFFCDCAGKEKSTCMALGKRPRLSANDEQNIESYSDDLMRPDDTGKGNNPTMPPQATTNSSFLRASMMDMRNSDPSQQRLVNQIESIKDTLVDLFSKSGLCETITNLIDYITRSYKEFAQRESIIGRSKSARSALDELHTVKKTFQMTESLMLPTLGSQEGAFEHVRMNYTGERANMVKHLIGNHTLRRVCMTSLFSPLGKRQHLVISHEKGKITLLQLNALLRQADSSKKKLTLTRVASAPMPFSVISIVANQFNEDVLAVCGMRDCHVLTFTSSGLVSNHIELDLDLTQASDYVIKAIWIPGSQTELAVVTSEMVKIFDLAESPQDPKYNLKLAFGKLKDVTFIIPDTGSIRYVLIMNTNGHIFKQELNPDDRSTGPFYVTTILQLPHPALKEQGGCLINGGGVSLYYSHSFKILFFSFATGNFMASMPKPTEVKQVFQLEFDTNPQECQPTASTDAETLPSGTSELSSIMEEWRNNKSGSALPLCQWSEIPGHSGLLIAFCQTTNNPVIIMLKPDSIYAQEIRYISIKFKITDATAIRHVTSAGEVRTTLILLCEDGSLRIYIASPDMTNFWLEMSPNAILNSVSQSLSSKSGKRKKNSIKSSKRPSSQNFMPTFPVDYFENLVPMNDVEFGGSDLLSVYTPDQLKNRLNSIGMHVTCVKTSGFSVDIINTDPNMVICGLRIQVGSQDLTRTPTSIEVLGRTTSIRPSSFRWYDLPLTRDESMQSDRKLTISFGPSSDPHGITRIDSIKVYGKTKESFSWPDDLDDRANSNTLLGEDILSLLLFQKSGGRYQKTLINAVEVLESCFKVIQSNPLSQQRRDSLARELSASLLALPYPHHVLKGVKSLISTIYGTRQTYVQHRDAAALDFVTSAFRTFEQDEVDGELFSRVVYIIRSSSQSKLSNLSKYSDCLATVLIEKDASIATSLGTDSARTEKLIRYMCDLFNQLYSQVPTNQGLSSVASYGYINLADTLQPLIVLIYIATLHNPSTMTVVTDVLIEFLMNQDLWVAQMARNVIIPLLRVKIVKQEDTTSIRRDSLISATNLDPNISENIGETVRLRDSSLLSEQVSSVNLDQSENTTEQNSSLGGSQQSLINRRSGALNTSQDRSRDGVRDFRENSHGSRQDNEDEIEVAIALSLQDDSQSNSATDNAVTAAPTTSGRSEMNFLSERMPSAEELMSDTTASGVPSDEETSASGPKTEHRDHKASVYECNIGPLAGTSQETTNNQSTQSKSKSSNSAQHRFPQQHLMLLERLIEHLPDTREVGGYRSMPLLHVILILTLDLDCESDVDDAILKNLLYAMRQELMWNSADLDAIVERNPTNEVKLVIMKMFSILMSRVRTSAVASAVSIATREPDICWSVFCSSVTAFSLVQSNAIDLCLGILKKMMCRWKSNESINQNQTSAMRQNDSAISMNRKIIPRTSSPYQLTDTTPFFSRPHVKSHPQNLFEEYSELLTEMSLKIPYQIKKVSSSSSNALVPVNFDSEWTTTLCEYLMTPIPSFIKKHVRKLLTFICGSKERYRQVRDFHFLNSHLARVKDICGHPESDQNIQDQQSLIMKIKNLNYDLSSNLVEHLKCCIDIAQSRCMNWQLFCLLRDQEILNFLLCISLEFCDDVATIILELLQLAVGSQMITSNQPMTHLVEVPEISTTLHSSIDEQTLKSTSQSLSMNLVQQLINNMPKETMSRFIQVFLLETNISAIRWQAHSLLCSLWSCFAPEQQLELLRTLWSLWHSLPKYGRKASQFVDLIGFMTLKSPPHNEEYDKMFCQETIDVLRQQNQLLNHHPNAHIYNSIHSLVDLDCYYLESEPCSVCNSPEVSYNNVKLSSIKVDSRFTTTTQIIKLNGSNTILKFALRIFDIKRSKMVKAVSIYYNNRSVQSVVELKNKSGLWNLARKQYLTPSQTDVKIDFTLPIIACNLMIEFSEFYENFQASSETLQCPRCSASVSANPGVCSNCGENVFQCHKCRAINYDEKDPFLCISCGFCKYARFDITLTAKPTCAVDPIENEEDRKKTVASISNLLDKADRVFKNLIQNKPTLELLLLRIHEQILPDPQLDSILSCEQASPISVQQTASGSSQSINSCLVNPNVANLNTSISKVIQILVQKYCVECKGLFEELSKITHMVLASRKELVEYDNKQLRRCLNANSSLINSADRRKSKVYSSLTSGSGRCYGCSTATVEHSITMLKALSTVDGLRSLICESGIIQELVNFNLRNSSSCMSREVRELLCLLTKDDLSSTRILTDLLMEKISMISKQDYQPYEMSHIIRHEIALLAVNLENEDQCWELRLQCLIKVFAFAFELKNPSIMGSLLVPCLKLLLSIARPPSPTTRRHKDKTLENIASVRSDNHRTQIPLQSWLDSPTFLFDEWRKKSAKPNPISLGTTKLKSLDQSNTKKTAKAQIRELYVSEKYANRWRYKVSKYNQPCEAIILLPNDWLKQILFDQSSKTVRLMARTLVETLFSVQSRRKDILDLLTSYLDEVGPAGDNAQEFYSLYKSIVLVDHWRYYLALRGILLKLVELISIEIDHLQELEETTLNSSLSLGCSLKMLVELLTYFVAVPKIMSNYKSKLVGFVLRGYLSLRKLIVQRTKLIDETQEMLLELLEGMTTGSEAETANFINVCVDAIKNCHDSDIRTPVFIFERLCSTIHPEENLNNEFFVSLDKDPQQEDFLQGRMVGNPYSSTEPGIGPLMKDIKNKICQDCELLALLEDDSSMELLVSNKIISLDLPVRDVYKRIWCCDNHENDAMRIVYRMRGLLGDATEEFIESLDIHDGEEVDEEEVFKMANVMATSGGLEIMLARLKQIDDLSPPLKPLLDVLLRLLTFCAKTQSNRQKLIEPQLNTVSILLTTLRLALIEEDFLKFVGLPKEFIDTEYPLLDFSATKPMQVQNAATDFIEKILGILEIIFNEATKRPTSEYRQFCSQTCGSVDDLRMLLGASLSLSTRLPNISQKLVKLLPSLTLGIHEKMSVLIKFFKNVIYLNQFDQDFSTKSQKSMDLFCIMVDAIDQNDNGNLLKDYIMSEGIFSSSLDYLKTEAPPLRSSLLANSEEWKNFTSRPALKYVLRFLAGLSRGHVSSQLLIAEDCIPIVHGLEQVSSDTRVGTLAENLLEAIKEHPSVAEKIELVRRQTKEEKKRLAMAVRERQLGALGMKANERGQVIARSKLLEQCLDLVEDSGLICNICREGYNFQPTKVLGIYTYTKRCVLDDFELKSRKTYGYSTVTHFNTVHVDCHMSAVRSARGREEWDSAALQNANTRCNGLLPIWGHQVPESAYANALARHNSYLQDRTGCRDIGYYSTIHDIRLQLLRFAQERSFSEDSGGGGPQSNIHLLPYMMQAALYVLNTTKTAARERKRALNYLEMSSNEILENCYEVDSPYYWTVLGLLVFSPKIWKEKRVQFLKRLLICNHVRRVSIKPPAPISDVRVRAYAYYKPAVIFFAIIDSFYEIVFKCAAEEDRWGPDWSSILAEYLKNNDQIVNENIEILLSVYQNNLLTCTSIEKFFEIVNIEEITHTSNFLADTLESI